MNGKLFQNSSDLRSALLKRFTFNKISQFNLVFITFYNAIK